MKIVNMMKNALMVIVSSKYFWSIGSCGEPSDSDSFNGIGFLIFAIIMILTTVGICTCTCVVSCV